MKVIKVKEATKTIVDDPDFHPTILPAGYSQYFTLAVDTSGAWVVDADSYVGLVPCASDVVVQIDPKVPMANLTYMLLRSGMLTRSFETPYEQTVPYQISEDDLSSFFEALVTSFLQELDKLHSLGLLRTAEELSSIQSKGSGRVDTVEFAHTYASTYGLHIPRIVTQYTVNNSLNRLLYGALVYLAHTPMMVLEENAILERLDYFGQFEGTGLTLEEIAEVQKFLEHSRLPSNRYYYATALNLALLILHNAGVTVGTERDVEFRPLLIRTDMMFERYIRSVCKELLRERSMLTLDGRRYPKPFYGSTEETILAKPDIILVSGGHTVSVLDVKYKEAPTAADHWQMWAYLEAHEVSKGAFISVTSNPNGTPIKVYQRRERTVYDLSFNASELKASELEVSSLLEKLLS